MANTDGAQDSAPPLLEHVAARDVFPGLLPLDKVVAAVASTTGVTEISSADQTVTIANALGPIVDLSVILPSIIVAGTSGIKTVNTATDTTVDTFLVHGVSSNNQCFGVTTSAGKVTNVTIDRDGLYIALGMVRWTTTGSYYAATGLFADAGVDFLNTGSIDTAAAVESSYPAALATPATTQQVFSLFNFKESAAPYHITMHAYQTSGSAKAIATAAFAVLRLSDNSVGAYD